MKSLQLVKKLEDKLLKSVGSFTFGKTIKDFEDIKSELRNENEKFKELLRENTALKMTLDRLNLQEIDNNKIYHIEEKLKKAQSYIKYLEEQLKNKQENGWMSK